METWKQQLEQSLTRPAQLTERFGVDPAPLEAVAARYPMRITPHYLGLIEEPGDPIWRQCVPDGSELVDDGLPEDPLAEAEHSPLPGVIHRYPDRVLLLLTGSCAAYCRFCTRKRLVGCAERNTSFGEVLAGIDYVARTAGVRDVILSGGDPLLLPDLLLKELLERLRRIPHLEVVRLATRTPVTLPERITEGLCETLRPFRPLHLLTHFNHPRELAPEAVDACRRLADAGAVLYNQTVLLGGVNDSREVLEELFRGLLRIGVTPYYLHQMDLVRGAGHFRTPVARGLSILGHLRGRVSGLAIPQYVIDLPGGRGKLPVLPGSCERTEAGLRLRTPAGEELIYPDIETA